jgi:hypothetical protein
MKYEYYYIWVAGVKAGNEEYPKLSLGLRIALSILTAIQVVTVIFIYQKSYELGIEMSSKGKRKGN